jgi:hypothetical protein
MGERDERKQTSADASKATKTTPKPGACQSSGISMEGTYLLSMWCPVWRRRDSHSGFRTELESLIGDVKRKGTSGNNHEAESIDALIRVGLLHSSGEAG